MIVFIRRATLQRGTALGGFILAMSFLTIAAIASVPSAARSLQLSEYNGVALIYNQEMSALGNRALFPICIGMPSGMPAGPLVRYLRNRGFEISDESLCEPAMAFGGQHHPKDYPHGLRIFIDKIQRGPAGVLSMRITSDDLTLRPGEHLAQTLRRGTYLLKQNEAGTWHIVDYKKEYDSADHKGNGKCNCAQTTGEVK